MPKPGYYYYENKRALRGIVFLSVFVTGIWLAKKSPPSNEGISELLIHHWVIMACGILVFLLFLFLIQHFQIWFKEPRPAHYRSRTDFIVALERYCERNGYKNGWVYYRSQELWPEP